MAKSIFHQVADTKPPVGGASLFHEVAQQEKVKGVSAPIPKAAADRRTFGLGAAEAHRPSYREPEEKPPSRLAEGVQPYMRAAELAGESITRGLSDTAGMVGTVAGAPVDLANWLINQVRRATGGEPVEEPVLGSAQLTRALQSPFHEAIAVGGEVEPEGRAEEIGAKGLEALGRNIPYALGGLGAAGRMATAAPAAGKALTGRSAVRREMLQKRLLGTPSEAAGIEKAILGGTTLGAGAAEAVAPGDETVGIIGELGGGLGAGLRAGFRAGARGAEAHIPDIPTVKEASKARVKAQQAAVKEIGQPPPSEALPSIFHEVSASDQGVIGAGKGLKGLAGTETTVKTTSGDHPVRYKVVELDDLIPSHDPQSFAEHPKYPKGVQERDYLRDKHAQMAVIKNADEYDPRFTVTSAPGPEHGPPVVGADGVVYGGNSRVMSTSRLYSQGKGENYTNYLISHADEFGLSPEAVKGMKSPVLVRELVDSPGTTRDAAALGSDLNKAFTRSLSEQEQAVAAGRRLSQETQDSVANALSELGETATIRDLLRSRPRDVLERLRADGVFSEEEITRFVDRATGAFNETGRDFVESLLLGSVIDNPALLASSPKSILAKIERSIAPLARLRAKGGEWDISESVKRALEIHTSANARGVTLEDFLSQKGLFEGTPDPLAAAVARKLQGTQKSVKEAFSRMAEDAAADAKNQQAFGFRKVPTAAESIAENLGVKLPPPSTPSGTALVRKGIVPPKSKWHANDPTPIPASDRSRSKTAPVLNEVDHITGAARQPTGGPVRKWLATKKERLQQLFTAEFTPLRTAERALYRMAGKESPWLDMAREFEQVAGAPAKAQGDIIRFTEAVIDPLKEGRWFRQPARSAPVEGSGVLAETEGLTGATAKKAFSVLDDFNSYLFLRRVESRLKADPKQKKVSNWTIEKAERGLQELHEKLGGEKFAMLEKQGKVYQEHMDRALRLQVEAGKIAEPLYQAIKKQNDFYAPFKLMRYLEDVEGGTARSIATTADLTKQIVGIDAVDFALSDFLIESVKQIYRSRILAEKNFKMLRLHDLAQIDEGNIFFRKVRPDIFYKTSHHPAEEILHQLSMQTTSRNPQLLEVSLTKVGKALQFAKESGLRVTKKIMGDALGRAQLGGAAEFNGKVFLNAFTSDVIAHELAHSFDTAMVDSAGNIIRNWKKVFGEDRLVISRLSSAINDRGMHEGITGKKLRVGQKTVFQQELSAVTDYTGLGGSPTYKARAVERFAEFVNLYIHDPRKARTLAPEFTSYFEKGILPNAKIKGLVENLSKFFQKIDGLPNVYTPLREMDDQNYLELAIRTAFPEGKEHLAVIFGERARKGYEIVKYHKDGQVQALEVTKDIASAIQGLTPGSSSLLVRTMQMAAMPLKLGATGMNAAFQPVNLFFADLPRAAFVSRYGIRNMQDLFKFPADYLYSFLTAVKGNFGHPNELYKQLLDSGALNSTIQRELTPGVFDPTSFQKGFGKKYILEGLPRLANAIEETGKTVGFKRALRLDEIAKMAPDQADEAIKRIVTEVRNFSGSPDFLRRGQAASGSNTANLNLLFMFFNARIQGASSDLARLAGKAEGGGAAAASAWKRMSAAVGASALTLAVYNHLPWNREDYEQVPLWERENYFMIPKFDSRGEKRYFTNDQGERVRDYWRIPKREITGLYGNMIEAGVKFAIDRDVATIGWFAGEFLENISPVTIIGETAGERGQSVISSLNPVFKVPIELALGKDTFRKRDIVPRTISGVASRDLSPEDQYTRHTPEVFKQIGKVTGPTLGVSPLQAEHAVRGATAGLVTQFLPRRAPGREGVSTWPVAGHVLARFQRSAGVSPSERSDRIREALVEQGGAKIEVNREAERVWEEMRALSPEEKYRRFAEVRGESPETAKRILHMVGREAKGIGWEEGQLGELNVKTGARGRFIASEIEMMPPEERLPWIAELRRAGLLSEEVWGQVLREMRR